MALINLIETGISDDIEEMLKSDEDFMANLKEELAEIKDTDKDVLFVSDKWGNTYKIWDTTGEELL